MHIAVVSRIVQYQQSCTFIGLAVLQYCLVLKTRKKAQIIFCINTMLHCNIAIYCTNLYHQWGCIKTTSKIIIHNQVSMCIHIDSRLPICLFSNLSNQDILLLNMLFSIINSNSRSFNIIGVFIWRKQRGNLIWTLENIYFQK